MGCIHTKNESNEIHLTVQGLSNIYRVNAIRIFAESESTQHGYLELSPKELSFSPQVGETIKWALQHLRRYGCIDDTFSFEAGRRCMSGPGIYTFRCQNAEYIHSLFQTYINTVARKDESTIVHSDFISPVGITSSHETYLEPATTDSTFSYNPEIQIYRDPSQSSPLNSNLNSPPSLQVANLTEVVHFNSQPCKHMHPKSNIYQEFPIKSNENNNNIPNKKNVIDAPPQEFAPNLQGLEIEISHCKKHLVNADNLHMYENVIRGEKHQTSERCYENFSSIELPLLLNEKYKNEDGATVNYITLDLVQSPTSVESFSLKPKSCMKDSIAALNNCDKNESHEDYLNEPNQDYLPTNASLKASTEICSNSVNTISENQSSIGYSTIDFIKTCALLKTVAACDANCQESRITRHSTCVVKNTSLNE